MSLHYKEASMKKLIICIILTLSTFFIACNSSPQRKDDQSSVNATKEILQMKHYKKDINGVIFDTDIVINQGVTEDSLIKSTASLIISDGEKLKKEFFNNKDVVSNDVLAGKDSVGNDSTFTYLTSSDSSYLSFNNSSSPILFRNKNFDRYISNSFEFIPNSEGYNADKYSTEKNFSFATQKEAFNNIKETMSSVGFDIGDNYKAYALDYETLKQEEHAIDKDGNEDKSVYKPSWSEEDNCYYFIIRPTIKNIPTFSKTLKPLSVNQSVLLDCFAPVKIIYNKTGIQFIDIGFIFKFNKSSEKVNLAPFEKIAEVVAEPYANMLGDNKYKVTKAELVYRIDAFVVKSPYPINLVWVINTEETASNDSKIINIETIVDAVSGKEIINDK